MVVWSKIKKSFGIKKNFSTFMNKCLFESFLQ
jgi:hypothetical protein